MQGSGKVPGAVHVYWAKVRPELKQHVAVHAAYVDALCQAAGVPEALSGLKKMLDLYAGQQRQAADHIEPRKSQGEGLPLPAPLPSLHRAGRVSGSSSMELGASLQPHAQVQGAASEASSQHIERGMQPYLATTAELGTPARGLQQALTQLERGSHADVEQSSVALRAAQAACHQVLNAAARARQTDVPQKVLRAMHQVTALQPASSSCSRRIGCYILIFRWQA